MSTVWLSIISVCLSTMSLALLVKSDAKRHRKTENLLVLSRVFRKSLGLLSVFPCVFCLALANYTALLVWLGAVTVVGWLLALLPSKLI